MGEEGENEVGKGIRGKERKRIGKREMGDEERRGRE